ncbi:MAG: primosomal protein N', partial [Candidatus Poseidoniia archaeon]
VPERARGPFARVAINRPVRCEFTYRVPAEFAKDLVPGMRVAVPFGAKREIGVVVGMDDATDVPTKRLKSIAASLDKEPVIDKELLDLTHWMAAYYACSWGEALAAILPASLKRERKQRTVLVLSAAEGIGDAELKELEEK